MHQRKWWQAAAGTLLLALTLATASAAPAAAAPVAAASLRPADSFEERLQQDVQSGKLSKAQADVLRELRQQAEAHVRDQRSSWHRQVDELIGAKVKAGKLSQQEADQLRQWLQQPHRRSGPGEAHHHHHQRHSHP